MNEQIKAIRAEIERLKEPHERNLKKPMERGRIGYAHGCVDCCDRILDFIDSLPEETGDGLEEAAEKYEQEHTIQRYDGGGFTPDSTVGIGEAFIAGAEWQKEQDQPITGNSLEKEWLRYVNKAKKEYGGELPSLGDYGWLQIARHFAEWQKAKMMEGAVEGEIVKDIHNFLHVKSEALPMPSEHKFGDKVRIIILPEEEQ